MHYQLNGNIKSTPEWYPYKYNEVRIEFVYTTCITWNLGWGIQANIKHGFRFQRITIIKRLYIGVYCVMCSVCICICNDF